MVTLTLLFLIYLGFSFLMDKYVRKDNYFYPVFAFIRDLPLKIINFILALLAVGTGMSIPIGIIGLIGCICGENSIDWVLECKVIIYPAMLIVAVVALDLVIYGDFGVSTRDDDF